MPIISKRLLLLDLRVDDVPKDIISKSVLQYKKLRAALVVLNLLESLYVYRKLRNDPSNFLNHDVFCFLYILFRY